MVDALTLEAVGAAKSALIGGESAFQEEPEVDTKFDPKHYSNAVNSPKSQFFLTTVIDWM